LTDHKGLPVSDDLPVLYSLKEAAGLLKLSRTSIFEQMRAGKLRGHKIGRRTVIKQDDLRTFMAALPAAEYTP
jgi:excisionase family DNA binding protein